MKTTYIYNFIAMVQFSEHIAIVEHGMLNQYKKNAQRIKK